MPSPTAGLPVNGVPGRVSGIRRHTIASAASPTKASPKNAAGAPSVSATHPAAVVLAVAPRPPARPSEPMARLR